MVWRYAKKAFAALALTVVVGVSGLAIVARIQGGKLLSVQSKSMVPILQKGDLVSVKRVSVPKLQVGDIITFISPKDARVTITHRIVETPSLANHYELVTKGDANQTTDPPTDPSRVLGKLYFSLPYIGYGADFIRKPIGLAIIIYIPALMIVGAEMKRLATYYKLQQPYTAAGYDPRRRESGKQKLASGAKITVFLLVIGLAIAIPARAALKSSVTLTGNTISTALLHHCTGGTNNTNIINITNNNNQTASSGNASSSGNTTGGSATSGDASNSSSTTININITNCH